MKQLLKQHLAIIVAFSLPLVLLIAVGINAFIASKTVKTSYNFLYVTCDSYQYQYCNFKSDLNYKYIISNNRLEVMPPTRTAPNTIDIVNSISQNHIFLYNTQTDTVTEITLAEAKNLNIFGGTTSPDGITFDNNYSYGADVPFMFSSRSKMLYTLSNGKASRRLNIDTKNNLYRYSFEFLGWVSQ